MWRSRGTRWKFVYLISLVDAIVRIVESRCVVADVRDILPYYFFMIGWTKLSGPCTCVFDVVLSECEASEKLRHCENYAKDINLFIKCVANNARNTFVKLKALNLQIKDSKTN